MKCSEITLREAIEYTSKFCPVKIIYNDWILYNDYDSNVVAAIVDGGECVYGEIMPPECVIPERIQPIDDYIVTSMNIEIVDFHHSIVTMQGVYKKSSKDNRDNTKKKCKDCDYAVKDFFKCEPGKYVCIGVKEPFVISDINTECNQY